MSQPGDTTEAQPEASSAPDQIDLLIRSTSSILHFVNPQAERLLHFDLQVANSKRSSKSNMRQVPQLDGLALLLNTNPKGDGAAVTAMLTADSINIYVAASDILVAKNSDEAHPESTAGPLPSIDWLKSCLSGGPFQTERHAVQFGYFIGELRSSASEDTRAKTYTELTRYIYFHCLPKLRQRLKHRTALDHPVSFMDIISNRSVLDCNDISSDYRAPKDIPPHELQACDETWLFEYLRVKVPNHTISLVKEIVNGSPSNVAHLRADASSSRAVFWVFRHALESITTQVDILSRIREKPSSGGNKRSQEECENEVIGALDSLISNMRFLSRLTYNSALFWHLLGDKAVDNAFKSLQKPIGPPGLTFLVGGEDEGDIQDNLNDGPADTRDMWIRWLKFLTRWQLALVDLNSGSLSKLIRSRALNIQVIGTLPPPSPAITRGKLRLSHPDDFARTLKSG